MWGQFLPRPSVALVVIFGLESPTLKGNPYKGWLMVEECLIRDDQWLKSTTSGTLQPLVIPYKAWRGKLSFQCETLQAKNDYKCNTWSRQKLSPQ